MSRTSLVIRASEAARCAGFSAAASASPRLVVLGPVALGPLALGPLALGPLALGPL
jgi:hypothetical protein